MSNVFGSGNELDEFWHAFNFGKPFPEGERKNVRQTERKTEGPLGHTFLNNGMLMNLCFSFIKI